MPTSSADQALANLRIALAAGRASARAALLAVGERMGAEVNAALSTPGPPVPGSPPRIRTGGLRASYRVVPGRSTDDGATVSLVSNHRAAAFLEFGTSKMAPRPVVRVVAAGEAVRMPRTIAAAWEAGVRGGAQAGKGGA